MLLNVVTPLFLAAAASGVHGVAVAEPLEERSTAVSDVCKQIEAAISDASEVFWPRTSHLPCLAPCGRN